MRFFAGARRNTVDLSLWISPPPKLIGEWMEKVPLIAAGFVCFLSCNPLKHWNLGFLLNLFSSGRMQVVWQDQMRLGGSTLLSKPLAKIWETNSPPTSPICLFYLRKLLLYSCSLHTFHCRTR